MPRIGGRQVCIYIQSGFASKHRPAILAGLKNARELLKTRTLHTIAAVQKIGMIQKTAHSKKTAYMTTFVTMQQT